MPKQKLLFVCEAVTLAHVCRSYELSKYMARQNYEVYFAFNGNFENLFEFDKINVKKIYSQSRKEFEKKVYFNRPLFDKQLLEKYILEELNLINEINPDLVIGDFRPSLKFSTKLKKVPLILISNFYWSPYMNPKMPNFKNFINDTFGKSINNYISNSYLGNIYMFFYLRGYNMIAKKYGLKSAKNVFEAYHNHDNVVYSDISELYPKEKSEIKKDYFLGPITWEPEISDKHKIRSKDIIYFSTGSSGKINQDILNFLLKNNRKVFLVTGGKKFNIINKKNLIVTDYAKASNFLKSSLFSVLNGGSPSVYQSLLYGVPVILCPSNIDQYLFSDLISNKYGIMEEDFYKIEKKLKILKKNAEKLSKVIKKYNPEEKFSRIVREILNKQSLNNK